MLILKMSNFLPFKVVGRGSETQLQEGENLNRLTDDRGNVTGCSLARRSCQLYTWLGACQI